MASHEASVAIDMGTSTALWARETVRLLLAEPLTQSPAEHPFPNSEWAERVCAVITDAMNDPRSSTAATESVFYLFLEAMHIARVGWVTALVTAQLAEYDEHSPFEMMTTIVDQWEKTHGWPTKPTEA